MSNELGNALAAALGSVSGAPLQHQRLVHLHTRLGPDVLVAESVDICESVLPAAEHAGFVIELTALSTRADLALGELLGQPALLELLTAESATQRRPLHGAITEAALVGSDGSLARYRLRLEPWLQFATLGQDSRSFHDMTVPQVIDTVLERHRQHGQLRAEWRWALADAAVYPQRSLVTQYQESDRAFIERLLLEEGLFAWFEHTGAAGDDTLGQHTLVLADHNHALADNTQARVRYTQSGASFKADSLARWSAAQSVHTHTVALASWDYRSVDLRPVQASGADATTALARAEVPAAYAYVDSTHGQRLAQRLLEQQEAAAQLHHAEGAWRHAAAGTVFTLDDHPSLDGRYAIVGTRLRARNPLGGDAQGEVLRRLGHTDTLKALLGESVDKPADAKADTKSEAKPQEPPLFQMQLAALPADVPVRSLALDADGQPQLQACWGLHRHPLVQGVQTAIVVSDGEPVLGDRDHRVKVQFHWQRGDNAPANGSSGTWVRVAESLAGANWGSLFMPRAGQEVVVSFLDGHIDRPVIVGAVYNGSGNAEAQGNQIGAGAASSSGNAPAWFPGSQTSGSYQGHQHDATLIGFKTQSLGSSKSGQGGGNQLVFDTHPEQARVEAASTAFGSRLQLGRLNHQDDNQRLQPRGHGADLATQASGAVRAASGLLLSARGHGGSVNAADLQLDTTTAQATLASSVQLHEALAQAAQTHKAKTASEPAPAQLPTALALTDAKTAWAVIDTRGGGEAAPAGTAAPAGKTAPAADAPRIDGGHGSVPAWSRPDLLLDAQAGVALHTPRHAALSSGRHWSLTAAADLNLAAQRSATVAVKDGIVWFTQGDKPAGRPVGQQGIQLHAASGSVSVQAQGEAAEVLAAKAVELSSSTAQASLSAPQQLQLAAAGSAIELKGGNITFTTPGGAMFKAAMKSLTGPGGGSESLSLPRSALAECPTFLAMDAASGAGSL